MAALPPGATPYRSPKGKINGYIINGERVSNRQIQQRFGTLAGTGATVERRAAINRQRGTPGAPLNPRPPKPPAPPKAPPRPPYRDRTGRFTRRPDETKVKGNRFIQVEWEVPQDLEEVVPSWPNYPPTIQYIKQLKRNVGCWVLATGKISPKYHDQFAPVGWKTVLTLRSRDKALNDTWSLGIFEEIYMIRLLWEERAGQPE